MTTQERITEIAERLPMEKRQELLDFAEFLQQRCGRKQPLRSAAGLWQDLGVDITEADIDEARREMWGNFPREDI